MTELEVLVRERIAREGPLPFSEVMRAALYHPRFGYYTNLHGFGADGDFITSPERHPAFGYLLGRQALDVWAALDRPRPFRILELGGGSGALAEPLVGLIRATVTELVYTIDEISPALRALQQQRLQDPAFRWHGTGEPAHFIIANEVADALPVERVVVRGGRLHELRVGLADDRTLTWVEHGDARPEVEAYFAALNYLPPEGQVADVCTELGEWVRSLARRLERGVALVLDYAASPPRDSLLTYFRHTMGSRLLARLGQQDISAAVDLRTLVRLAVGEGLQADAVVQQRLLVHLGLQQVQAVLRGSTDREALAGLLDPRGLGGRIMAVFLLRGLPGYRPVGAVGGGDWPAPHHVPSLPPDQAEADFLSQWHEAFGPR